MLEAGEASPLSDQRRKLLEDMGFTVRTVVISGCALLCTALDILMAVIVLVVDLLCAVFLRHRTVVCQEPKVRRVQISIIDCGNFWLAIYLVTNSYLSL